MTGNFWKAQPPLYGLSPSRKRSNPHGRTGTLRKDGMAPSPDRKLTKPSDSLFEVHRLLPLQGVSRRKSPRKSESQVVIKGGPTVSDFLRTLRSPCRVVTRGVSYRRRNKLPTSKTDTWSVSDLSLLFSYNSFL